MSPRGPSGWLHFPIKNGNTVSIRASAVRCVFDRPSSSDGCKVEYGDDESQVLATHLTRMQVLEMIEQVERAGFHDEAVA